MRYLKRKANDLLNNTFYFDRPWDMEQDITKVVMQEIDWGYQRGDPEWTYMLNRMEYLIDLSVYAKISNSGEYATKVEALMLDWISSNDVLKQNYHRTLDTGIRLLSWSYGLENLTLNSQPIIDSINEQVSYLKLNYRLKDDLSNWGLLQSIGVLSCSKYLEQEMIDWWMEKLNLQLNLQITNDGFHWEHSILYHNQILLGLCRLQDINANVKLQPYIDCLAISTYETCKPNYHQVQQNDSDDTDVSGLLAFAYKLTHNEMYRFELKDSRLDILCLEENVIKPRLKNHNKLYKDSGLSIVRKDDMYLSAHNHPYGSSHSHLMWGHVNFYSDRDILIDPGRYTYVDDETRRKLKSIEVHNCAVNKSIYQEDIKNSWDTSVNAYSVSTEKFTDDDIDVTTINYSMGGRTTTRYVVLINKQLLIFDKIKQIENEIIESNLVFDPHVKLNGLILENRDYKIEHNYQRYCKIEVPNSKKYNQLESTSKLRFQSTKNELVYYQSLIEKSCKLNEIALDANSVAYRLYTNNSSYIIYICPIEVKIGTKVKRIADYSLYGQLVIVNENTGKIYQVKI